KSHSSSSFQYLVNNASTTLFLSGVFGHSSLNEPGLRPKRSTRNLLLHEELFPEPTAAGALPDLDHHSSIYYDQGPGCAGTNGFCGTLCLHAATGEQLL